MSPPTISIVWTTSSPLNSLTVLVLFFAIFLGSLNGNELVAVHLDYCLDVASVGGGLVKLLVQFELQLHRLERSRGLDYPISAFFGDLHHGSGDGGRLAQEVVDAESGEELFVLLRGGALILADEVGRHLKAGR